MLLIGRDVNSLNCGFCHLHNNLIQKELLISLKLVLTSWGDGVCLDQTKWFRRLVIECLKSVV